MDEPRRLWRLEIPQGPGSASRLAVAQDLALLVAFVLWARVVTGRTGGRAEGALLLGCASLVPALLLLRPRWRACAPVLVLTTAALGVCWLAPFGWSGASMAATAAYAGAAFAVVLSYVRRTGRAQVLASAVCLASLDQFAQGFLAWWGGGDPASPMIGTFFWHNQFAAFLLPGVLLGAAQALAGERIHRVVGWVTAPICVAGIVLSTSRSSMVLAGVGLVMVALVVLAEPASPRGRRVGALAGLGVLAAGVTLALTSPALFQDKAGSPVAATAARSAEESVGRNTEYRWQFWKAAVAQVQERPLVGGGFGSFRELSGPHLPPASVRPSSAHNELLQGAAEGGLLWAMPLAACLLAGLGAAAALLLRQLRRPGQDVAVCTGAAVSLGAVLGHALVDFDWSYPALALLAGLLAGLVWAVWRPEEQPAVRSEARRAAGGWLFLLPAAVVSALVLGAGQLSALHERTTDAVARSHALIVDEAPAKAAVDLLAERAWSADPRTSLAVLIAGLPGDPGDQLRLDRAVLEQALRRTERLGGVSDSANARRAAVIFALGRRDEALRLVREMAEERAHSRPATLQAYARLLSLDGQGDTAVATLAGTVLKRAPELRQNPGLGEQLVVLYEELATLDAGSLAQRCAGDALATAGARPVDATGFARLGLDDGPGSCQEFLRAGWS